MKVILKKKDIELLSLDLAVRSIYFTFQDWTVCSAEYFPNID